MATPQNQQEVAHLLNEVARGGRAAVDRLVPVVYDELRRIAHRRLAGERNGHTLDTTGLVHETYLELVGFDRLEYRSRAQFFAIAAQAMRRVLIDYAVARTAKKRGGTQRAVPLDAVPLVADERTDELLALDEALERLSALDARQSRVVECRFFGGMSIDETAVALDISGATVKRDWNLARAWLGRELDG